LGSNKLVISYPQGSGGTWFAHLLDCMINNNRFYSSKTNWHSAKAVPNPRVRIVVNHELANPDFNLSGFCIYNFWCYYYVKRFVYDLGGPRPHQNSHGRVLRIVKCPYQNNAQAQQDFEWMFLQAKFIAQYNLKNTYNMDFVDLVNRPDRFYNNIIQVLNQRGIEHVDDYDFFLTARNTYIDSIKNLKKSNINVNHHHYRLWELAYIDGVLDRSPGFDYFEYFGTSKMQDWINQFRPTVLDQTNQVYLKIK
jgi:hypothetical protein